MRIASLIDAKVHPMGSGSHRITRAKLWPSAFGNAALLIGVACIVALAMLNPSSAPAGPVNWSYPETAAIEARDCWFTGLPDDVVVYAISVKEGDLLSDLFLSERAHHDTRAIEVLVSLRDQPIVLVLSAEDRVIWNLSIVEGVQLAGVVVLGKDAQGLVGIPESLPHLVLTKGSVPGGCPDIRVPFASSRDSDEFHELGGMVETIVGRPIDNFQSARRGGRFIAGPRSQIDASELLYSDELEANYFKAAEVMPPGWGGLDWLLGQGLIRRATKEDLNGWIAGVVPEGTPLGASLWAKYRMIPSRTFMILGEIDIPENLKWDGSYSFIVPDGVPEPGHGEEAKTIFLMKGFSCIPKAACRR